MSGEDEVRIQPEQRDVRCPGCGRWFGNLDGDFRILWSVLLAKHEDADGVLLAEPYIRAQKSLRGERSEHRRPSPLFTVVIHGEEHVPESDPYRHVSYVSDLPHRVFCPRCNRTLWVRRLTAPA